LSSEAVTGTQLTVCPCLKGSAKGLLTWFGIHQPVMLSLCGACGIDWWVMCALAVVAHISSSYISVLLRNHLSICRVSPAENMSAKKEESSSSGWLWPAIGAAAVVVAGVAYFVWGRSKETASPATPRYKNPPPPPPHLPRHRLPGL